MSQSNQRLYGDTSSLGLTWAWVRVAGQRVWAYRAVCSISLLVFIALVSAGQLNEAIVDSGTSFGDALQDSRLPVQVIFAIVSLSLLPLFLWTLAIELYRWRRGSIAPPGYIIALICAAPLVMVLVRMYDVLRAAGGLQYFFQVYEIWGSFAIPILCLFGLGFSVQFKRNGGRSLFVVRAAQALAVVVLVLIPALTIWPDVVAPLIGPFTLISVFCAMLAILGTVAAYAEDELGVPVTLALVLAAFTFSALDWNDNHNIRLRETAVPADPVRFQTGATAKNERGLADEYSELENRFLAWLDCRPDYDPDQKGYVVYLAAAQGGGLYAAYHSSRFMALAQDMMPGFSSRVFAVSGVSGGSVGAAVFGSVMRDYPARAPATTGPCALGPDFVDRPKGFYSHAIEQIINQDYLSPVGAGMMFADFGATVRACPDPGRRPCPCHRARV